MPAKIEKKSFAQKLLEVIEQKLSKSSEKQLFIQTHNFPDNDAVASAWALQALLANVGISAHLIYDGNLERDSLKRMIRELNITIHHYTHFDLTDQDKIIIVDGCKGNRNVTDLIGEEIAVIDHHFVTVPDDVVFSDIRTDFGACASILFTYFQNLEVDIPQDLASALMIAIHTDTAGMTRHTSHSDLLAYTVLNEKADVSLVTSILRNDRRLEDLPYYEFLVQKLIIKNKMGFCYFSDGCPQNLLGILGDFVLSLDEVDFVILSARNKNHINLSLRSEDTSLHCGLLLSEVLQGIGFGGGHAEMAGGIISNHLDYDPELFFSRFLEVRERT